MRIVDYGFCAAIIFLLHRRRGLDMFQDCRQKIRFNQLRQDDVMIALELGTQCSEVRRGIRENNSLACQPTQFNFPVEDGGSDHG